MNYTEEELKDAKFLIKKIGFVNEKKITQLLEHYHKEYSYVTYTTSTKGVRNRKGKVYKYVNVYNKEIQNERCLGVLNWEVRLREEYNEIELKNNDSDYISATDLASFIFCPASYSILKSFIIKHSLNLLKINKGSELHEELNLIQKRKNFGFSEEYISKLNDKQKRVLNKIKSCQLIYNGHSDNAQIFVNQEKKFIGQPDYIFIDPNNNYFIVEEKYHFQKSNDLFKFSEYSKYKHKDFYPNNIIQLQSYVDCIKEYDIKYGILINWYYYFDYDNNKIIFNDYTYKVIKKGFYSQSLEKTFNDILNFKDVKTIEFDNNVNLKKCLNCSVNLYCSHKTDNFDKLQIPYNISDLKLKCIEDDS